MDEDARLLNAFYSGRYREFGFDSRSTGYSPTGQQVRYRVLASLLPAPDASVLEIGAGLGHFYSYLKSNHPAARYVGYEINPDFLRETKQRFGDAIREHNILTEPPPEKMDAVFSVGILNTKITDNMAATRRLMEAMFNASRNVAALSMTSIFIEEGYTHDYMFYYDPAEIFRMAKSITRNVALLHDYLPHDFTVVLRRSS